VTAATPATPATSPTGSQGAQQELLGKADRYLAGGGLGLFVLPPEVNLVIAEGRGGHVVDVSGRELIDYHLGSGPALLGHGHPAITAAVTAQVPKGSTYYFLNEHVVRLAERLVAAVPCAGEPDGQVQFTGSGTEATFFALRVARALTGRTKVLKFEGGWHGMHDYALWGTVPQEASD
jgi:glutamate-1-semialdehyde 2,1-aminomutase